MFVNYNLGSYNDGILRLLHSRCHAVYRPLTKDTVYVLYRMRAVSRRIAGRDNLNADAVKFQHQAGMRQFFIA